MRAYTQALSWSTYIGAMLAIVQIISVPDVQFCNSQSKFQSKTNGFPKARIAELHVRHRILHKTAR